MIGMTTSNGAEPERLNSRTITVWLPQRDLDYLNDYATELGLEPNNAGKPNRNGGLRAIIAEHRKLRAKRLARKS
jgi:hypothetical protein